MRIKKALFVALAIAALSDCTPSGPRMVATGQQGTQHLTVDLSYVYWTTTDGKTSTLFKALKDDNQQPVQVAAVPGSVEALAVDDDGLYMVISGGDARGQDVIRKIPRRRGSPAIWWCRATRSPRSRSTLPTCTGPRTGMQATRTMR